MTPEDLKSLCVRYGLVMAIHYEAYNFVYLIYDPLGISPLFSKPLGKFTASELPSSDPRDVEAQVVEWSLKATFGAEV